MTTTSHSTTRAASNGQSAHVPRGATVVTPKGRRRPGLITAGVALAMLGALVAVWLVTSAGDRTDVVMLGRDVPYGATLTSADLVLTAVAVDPAVAVSYTHLRAHETRHDLVCRLLLEKKKK